MLYQLQKKGAEDGSQQPSQTILVDNSGACEKKYPNTPKGKRSFVAARQLAHL